MPGIPDDPGAYNTGLVLLTNGTKMLLFAISSDAANSVRYTTWDGSLWSAWMTLFSTSAKRASLSGSGCASKRAHAITWTEGVAAPYRVVGAEVTKLF